MLLICYPDLTTDSKDSVEFDDFQEAIGFNGGEASIRWIVWGWAFWNKTLR